MHIIINDIAAERGGALTILRQFYNYIKDNCKEDKWTFLLGSNVLEETDNIKIITLPNIKKNHWKKVWFDCIKGRTFIESLQPDVVFSSQNIITFGLKVPQVVYVHQSIPFQNIKDFSFFRSNERKIAFIQKIIGFFIIKSVQHANAVIVQTPWMLEAVSKKSNINKSKITVAKPDSETVPINTSAKFSAKCFFYPTNNNIYKNIDTVIKACDLLVSSGIDDFKVKLTLLPGTINHPNIECIGYLNRDELFKHYASSVLLFPSYIETVGLPLLEAASLGMPIIVADCPYAHDVLEVYDNVSYFPPFEYKKLAFYMGKTIDLSHPHFKQQIMKNNKSEWKRVINIIKNIKNK